MTGKDVWVSVCGSSDADEVPVREDCSGVWQKIGSADCVRYIQKTEDGPDTAVLLRIEADRLSVIRRGAIESSMVFRTGERHLCKMKTPAGLLEFDVVTTLLKIGKPGTGQETDKEQEQDQDRKQNREQEPKQEQEPEQEQEPKQGENGMFPVCIRAEYDLEAQGCTISSHILEMVITEAPARQHSKSAL